MFERFTREARTAVTAAQQLARDAGSGKVDTRHVLVALLGETDPVAATVRDLGVDVATLVASLRRELRESGLDREALASLGIDLDAVRERADAVFGPGALDRAGHSPGHIPFSRDAKKALELALREAIRLKHRTIDGRHLVLGMLRAECPARGSLVSAGVDPARLRAALETQGSPGAKSA
jgi:ATP-dependent Clp protease ATP-binding subunit ClpA